MTRSSADNRDALVLKISAALAEGKDSGGYGSLLDMYAHIALKVIEAEPQQSADSAVLGELRERLSVANARLTRTGRDYDIGYRDALGEFLDVITARLLNEPKQSADRETERAAFIDKYHKNLDLTEMSDAWGRPMFKHSHVEALWDGWLARASIPAVPQPSGETR